MTTSWRMHQAVAAFAVVAIFPAVGSATTIKISNQDPPGVGLNDPSSVTPQGGNAGTTLGEQRLNVFKFAASVWEKKLSSSVPIVISAKFSPLDCSSTGIVLGSTGENAFIANQDIVGPVQVNGPPVTIIKRNTIAPKALLDAALGYDIAPPSARGFDPTTDPFDMFVQFNSDYGTARCGGGGSWYLGLDGNPPTGSIELVATLIHEFSHGLGFTSFVNVSAGQGRPALGALPFSSTLGAELLDAFSVFIFDAALKKPWESSAASTALTTAERGRSLQTPQNVVFKGFYTQPTNPSFVRSFDPGTPALQITAPRSAAASVDVGTANFGKPVNGSATDQISGALAVARSSAGSDALACQSSVPLVDLTGKIALVDRGVCSFAEKALVAQQAGAIAVVVINVSDSSTVPLALAADNPPVLANQVTVPVVSVTQATGASLKTLLSGQAVNVTLGANLSRRKGTDPNGYAYLYTPTTVQPGSSVSHWDTSVSPSKLMEPFYTGPKTSVDITLAVLRDIGWTVNNTAPTARASVSRTGSTVTLDGSDSSDDEFDPLKYSWSQRSGDGVRVTLSDASAAKPTFSLIGLANSGTLNFDLVVNDGSVASSPATVSVLLNKTNPPTAQIAAAGDTKAGASVTLDGSGSNDPDGGSLSFSWRQISGPNVVLTSATESVATFRAPAVPSGQTNVTLGFELMVTALGVQSTPANTIITVRRSTPIGAVASASLSKVAADRVELDGRPSTADGGLPIQYKWVQTAGDSVALTDAQTAVASFVAPSVAAPKDFVFALTVTEGGYASANPATVTVQVSPAGTRTGGSVNTPSTPDGGTTNGGANNSPKNSNEKNPSAANSKNLSGKGCRAAAWHDASPYALLVLALAARGRRASRRRLND